MTLVTLAATDMTLVQCADCDRYAIDDEAEALGWVTNTDGDYKCAECFHAWIY